jgi:predicted esterase
MAMSSLHRDGPVLAAGAPLPEARAAVVMLHGRGATAESILSLSDVLPGEDIAYLAPQAIGGSWYPHSFLAPIESNEPWLTSSLEAVGDVVSRIEAAGIPPQRIALLGFSQGACLVLEYAARHARRWGGVIGFSGGLIGPDGTSRDYGGSLDGTPVFLGCSDVDGHIPQARVEETAQVLERLGGAVTMRLYPGMGHTVNANEIAHAREIIAGLPVYSQRAPDARTEGGR